MEKLINSAFDFFAYALPGFCILASFFILDETLNTSRDFLKLAGELQLGSGIVLLGLGYVVGFAVTPLGRMLYKSFQKSPMFVLLEKALKGKHTVYEPNETDIFISDKFVLVREMSPSNFKYIESWHVYSLMSHNMAIASLLTVGLSISKIIWCRPTQPDFWWKTAMLAFLLAILFVYSAVKFNIWSTNDQNAAIKRLRLIERAEKLGEPETGNQPAKKS